MRKRPPRGSNPGGKRGCKKGSRSRQLFWHRDGTPVNTEKLWVTFPEEILAKIWAVSELTGESTSVLISAIVSGHFADPNLFITPTALQPPPTSSPEGRNNIMARFPGGFLELHLLNELRPLLTKLRCSPWRLFAHFLHKTSLHLKASYIQEAIDNPYLDEPIGQESPVE